MSCEDTPATRITWEIQLYEPCSRSWMCRGYGRATTTATPADIAAAVLAGYLTATPARATETFRVIARTDTGQAATVTADQLPDEAWTADPTVRKALPLYLRDALAHTGGLGHARKLTPSTTGSALAPDSGDQAARG